MSDNVWDDLPNICSEDRELITFFGHLYFGIKEFSLDLKILDECSKEYLCSYAKDFLQNEKITSACFKEDLIEILKQKAKSLTKKQVVRIILENIIPEYSKLKQNLILYFGRLYALKITPLVLGSDCETCKNYEVSLCDDNAGNFLSISFIEELENHNFDGIRFSPKDNPTNSVIAIEELEVNGFRKVDFQIDESNKDSHKICFKQVGIDSLVLSSVEKSKYFEITKADYYKQTMILDSEKQYIDIYCQINCGGDINIKKDTKDRYTFSRSKYKSIDCENFKGSLKFNNCNLSRLRWKNCNFAEVPSFDDESSIKLAVYIDESTLRNMDGKGSSLDFLNLAEFLNRNKAYIEAQSLHRFYLLSKREEYLEEQNKKDNNKLKKWCKDNFNRYLLVKIYDSINSCGNNLLKPVCLTLCSWLFVYLIFLFSTCFIIIDCSDFKTYLFFHVLYSIKQATLVIVPLLATIEKPQISCLNLYPQILVYLLMIFSYLLFFLMALQIRKFLKLKD